MKGVTLIDSPVANVANIARALRAAGAELEQTADPRRIREARKLVLPGVGSFRAAMSWLQRSGTGEALVEAAGRGTPVLGICVGHQVLFQWSEEMGTTPGLSLLRGGVGRLRSALPVPQIGWNRVTLRSDGLFAGIADGTPFYFVNSFVAAEVEDEVATAHYGTPFTAAVQRAQVYGVQFHPEKSSSAGLQVLANFVNL